ncbi:MAG: ATP-binding protein [Candidatus Gastranaerophilales bacterium]|nr:ATP-binding protein [Candidatus Gastranaerophilales bacterium]
MEQAKVYRFSLDNALEMILIFNEEGRILYANQKAKVMLEYENLQACNISDIFPGSFRERDGSLLIECPLDTEEELDLDAYRGNRTCFPVRMRVLRDEVEPSVYHCMAYDASERNFLMRQNEQTGQEAESAQKVKASFVANVTHELRTPVNGILGNTQELVGLESDPRKLELLSLVERGCADMNSIINSILDFSKLEAGKFMLEPRKFNFRNMVDYVKANHSNRIVEKGLDFFVTISPEIPEFVIGDELRIVQVLNNLLSNAYKFTSIGKISLEIVKTAQIRNRVELFFLVIDTGIGIDKADQDKLFKSFSQVDVSTSRKYGGAGLGLNICKQLVELMGGNIHLESEAGKGSTFSFHIWLELPGKDEINAVEQRDPRAELHKLQMLSRPEEAAHMENMKKFGEPENLEEIRKKLSKLNLSIEMENWEKAEMFCETVRQLTEDAPREVKSPMLRLKMAVQKADYDKAAAASAMLQEALAGLNPNEKDHAED